MHRSVFPKRFLKEGVVDHRRDIMRQRVGVAIRGLENGSVRIKLAFLNTFSQSLMFKLVDEGLLCDEPGRIEVALQCQPFRVRVHQFQPGL